MYAVNLTEPHPFSSTLSSGRLPDNFHAMQVPAIAAILAVLYGVWQWMRSRQRVFLLDFACYKPPENLKVCLEDFMKGSRASGVRRSIPS